MARRWAWTHDLCSNTKFKPWEPWNQSCSFVSHCPLCAIARWAHYHHTTLVPALTVWVISGCSLWHIHNWHIRGDERRRNRGQFCDLSGVRLACWSLFSSPLLLSCNVLQPYQTVSESLLFCLLIGSDHRMVQQWTCYLSSTFRDDLSLLTVRSMITVPNWTLLPYFVFTRGRRKVGSSRINFTLALNAQRGVNWQQCLVV